MLLKYTLTMILVLLLNNYATANNESIISADIVEDCVDDNGCPIEVMDKIIKSYGTSDIVNATQTSKVNELNTTTVTQLSTEEMGNSLYEGVTHTRIIDLRDTEDKRSTEEMEVQRYSLFKLTYYQFLNNTEIIEHAVYNVGDKRVQYIVISSVDSASPQIKIIKEHAINQYRLAEAKKNYDKNPNDINAKYKFANAIATLASRTITRETQLGRVSQTKVLQSGQEKQSNSTDTIKVTTTRQPIASTLAIVARRQQKDLSIQAPQGPKLVLVPQPMVSTKVQTLSNVPAEASATVPDVKTKASQSNQEKRSNSIDTINATTPRQPTASVLMIQSSNQALIE